MMHAVSGLATARRAARRCHRVGDAKPWRRCLRKAAVNEAARSVAGRASRYRLVAVSWECLMQKPAIGLPARASAPARVAVPRLARLFLPCAARFLAHARGRALPLRCGRLSRHSGARLIPPARFRWTCSGGSVRARTAARRERAFRARAGSPLAAGHRAPQPDPTVRAVRHPPRSRLRLCRRR
jgi:hypothetical protein